jgi:hypothetical protein
MYRYREQEKFEGKTILTGGVTQKSRQALKHLPKIGTPLYVKGYIYKGAHHANHVGVLVKGTEGVIRFGGFSWGYCGEGCRGLAELFTLLGIKENPETIAEWPSFNDLGEHWRINLN